jgi:hypothetical protein
MMKCRCLQDLAGDMTIKELESSLRALARDEAWPELRSHLA